MTVPLQEEMDLEERWSCENRNQDRVMLPYAKEHQRFLAPTRN